MVGCPRAEPSPPPAVFSKNEVDSAARCRAGPSPPSAPQLASLSDDRICTGIWHKIGCHTLRHADNTAALHAGVPPG
jgi:hypothetical protein